MLYFNELSCDFRTNNENEAVQTLSLFFEACLAFQKRRYITKLDIVSSIKFSSIYFSETFTFTIWIGLLNKEKKREVLALIASKPIVREYPPYYFLGQQECIGLGLAFENNGIGVSFPYQNWPYPFLIFQKIESNQTIDVQVKHIAYTKHVEEHYPSKIFEHHSKHDQFRLNTNDGESTLWYNINAKSDFDYVQKLLDMAEGGGKLFIFDYNKDMYIEFQATGGNGNIYHGYHIEDETRVPYEIRKKQKK